jgi:hypothetical protein
VREKRDLRGRVGVRRVGIEGLAPGGALGVIHLAEVKHLPLCNASIVQTFIFHHTPVSVFLAIFFGFLDVCNGY